MKYRCIEEFVGYYSITVMCRALEVSIQGYFQWKKRAPEREKVAQGERIICDKLRVSHADSRKTYGRIRLTKELQAEGITINEKKVRRLMRQEGLKPKAAKRYKQTTDSSHTLPRAEHLLGRNFCASAPNQKWVGDITYIYTNEGWLYLSTIIDLFNRKVVGWAMDETMTSALVCSSLTMAVNNTGSTANTLCHFDQGSQYASNIFQALLKHNGFTCSMSRKGNCWDNAVAESFFHTLKVETINGVTFKTREEAKSVVFEYIEGFYNNKRRHSSLGYLSPVEFEKKYNEQLPQQKAA